VLFNTDADIDPLHDIDTSCFCNLYSKTPLLRPPLGLRKNGLYSGVVLLLN